MDILDSSFKEMLSSSFISVIGGLAAGIALAAFTGKLLVIPGILLILPGFLEMRGSISGTFASRLSAGLFLGVVKSERKNTRITRGNMLASFSLAVLVSFVLGIMAMSFNYIIVGSASIGVLLLPVLAGIIANAIEIPFTLFVTFYLFRRGHDPNNIMGPLVTTTGDIVSIMSLLIALVII